MKQVNRGADYSPLIHVITTAILVILSVYLGYQIGHTRGYLDGAAYVLDRQAVQQGK